MNAPADDGSRSPRRGGANRSGNPRTGRQARGRGASAGDRPGGAPGQRSAQRSVQRPSERSRRTDPSRLAAYTVLRSVDDGGYANLDLPAELRRRRLSGRDAAFATELTYGATRLRGIYDRIIAIAADRPIERLDPGVRDTLRLGAHQVLSMRVPPHAAADESVALARTVNGAGAAGLVNAVMRRITEADLAGWVARLTEGVTDPTERAAIAHSHPEWVARALRQALLGHGASTPERIGEDLQELLAADNAAAEVVLAARPGLVEAAELLEHGATPHPHVPGAYALASGDPAGIPAIRQGRAAVQDAGSQVVALVLAAAGRDGPGGGPGGRERWLDLCAGPGGKAGLLAALAIQRGADLVANELTPHRAELVRKTLTAAVERSQEADVTIEVRTGDGREYGTQEPLAYDRILIDAPCTGLGALRRRPEARWRRTPGDIAALNPLQRELLLSGIDALAPGGVLVYATCSPHLAETRFMVADALKARPGMRQLDAREILSAVTTDWAGTVGEGPAIQLWPHVHGTDAMFLAVLHKAD